MAASILDVKSVQEFEQILTDAASWLVVAHFWADWAPQCAQMNEVLQELAQEPLYVNCKFVKVEAEAIPELSQKYTVSAVPTCVLLKNKSEVARVNGANVPELTKKVSQHGSPSAAVPASRAQAPKEDLNTRLKRLISSAPVILFMKGNKDEPRCGFSRQIISILDDQGIKYSTFDILSDEEVRQGLKTFSDWPTYPQLYADGELLGGLDIVKEMVESGDLKEAIPTQLSLDERLKALINKAKCVIFIKGQPNQPKCGFSKTLVGILADTGVSYEHFDILTDDEVRQGLKTFSNWPTYPQVYVDGELIGGLDIIQELKETDELEAALKGESS